MRFPLAPLNWCTGLAKRRKTPFGPTVLPHAPSVLPSCGPSPTRSKRADAITEISSPESGLPEARIQGERGRTTDQLRLFADHIEAGDYLDRRHDGALPDRTPLPRPDLNPSSAFLTNATS